MKAKTMRSELVRSQGDHNPALEFARRMCKAEYSCDPDAAEMRDFATDVLLKHADPDDQYTLINQRIGFYRLAEKMQDEQLSPDGD